MCIMQRFTGFLALLFLFILVLTNTSPVLSDTTYFIYDQYGGTWQDANKTGHDDSLMCWAAAASNILEWGGWGTSQDNTAQTIFGDYAAHWTNNTGYPSWAWNWWFNGSGPIFNFNSYPDVAGGGDYYPTLNFSNYFSGTANGDLMAAIDVALHQGQGVTMILGTSSGGSHAVTAWGFSESAPRSYTNIYITDSDDGTYGLAEYPLIYQNNAWYLGGFYSGWEIDGIQTLAYDPNSSAFSSLTDVPSSGDSPVPLAPSWVLFGTGVFLLFLLSRWRRQAKLFSPCL